MIRTLSIKLFTPLLWLAFIVFTLAIVPYLFSLEYYFPEEKPFSGPYWYNPYQEIKPNAKVLKANFHAHTHSWAGLTNGEDAEEQLIKGYEARGYDITGISNYHKFPEISQNLKSIHFPLYEHGYNLKKSHRMVFGGNGINYFDFPFYQTSAHKQYLIDLLKGDVDAIAINHPSNRNGHSKADMQKIVGYDFVEVMDNSSISVEEWDAALSAGRLSWLLSNDDTHDVKDTSDTFRKWNMIFSESRNYETVLKDMKAGKMYGINSVEQGCENLLEQCKIIDDTLNVEFSNKQKSLVLLGENGKRLDVVYNTAAAKFALPAGQSYVRVFGFNPDCHTLLNPIIKWDGKSLPLASEMEVEVNWLASLGVKLLTLLIIVVEVLIFLRLRKWLEHKAKN